MWAEEGVNLADFMDHFGPTFGRETPGLVLYYPERKSLQTRLFDLAPMAVGGEAVVSDGNLAFIGDTEAHLDDELQVIHPFQLFGALPISVANFLLLFIKGEELQGKQWRAHLPAHRQGLSLCKPASGYEH